MSPLPPPPPRRCRWRASWLTKAAITIHYYRDTYEYMLPHARAALWKSYQARVRPVAPPLLLHLVDQIIFSTSRYGSLFACRTDLARKSRDIADILIKQIGHFNRVIDQQLIDNFLGADPFCLSVPVSFRFFLNSRVYNSLFSILSFAYLSRLFCIFRWFSYRTISHKEYQTHLAHHEKNIKWSSS